MTASSTPRTYAAFISYRHDDNRTDGRRWASWLHNALETYEVPVDLVGTPNLNGEAIPERIYPVFRDEEELPADAALARPILRALRGARVLIVLCSPRAAASRFVADEVRQFKAMGKSDRVIAAVIAGEPNASRDPQKAGAEECFPAPLRVEVASDGTLTDTAAEPLAADFRLEDGGEGYTSPAAHREALAVRGLAADETERRVDAYSQRLELMKLKIIAGLLGVELGVLTRRDQAHQLALARRRATVLRRWLAAVGVLLLLALAAGGLALDREREARTQRRRAVEALAASDFQRGSELLLDPRTTPTGIAHLARAARLGHRRALTRLFTLRQQRAFWVPADDVAGAPEVTATEDVPAAIASRFQTVEIDGARVPPHHIAVSADGSRVAALVPGTDIGEPPRFRVFESDGTPLTDWTAPTFRDPDMRLGEEGRLHLSADGAYVALEGQVWRSPAFIQVFPVGGREAAPQVVRAVGRDPNVQWAGFQTVRFLSHEGRTLLLVATSRGAAMVNELEGAPEFAWMHELGQTSHLAPVVAVNVDRELEWLMSASDDQEVQVRALDPAGDVGAPFTAPGRVTALARRGEGGLALRMADGRGLDWRLVRPLVLDPVEVDPALAEGCVRGIPDEEESPGPLRLRDDARRLEVVAEDAVVGTRVFETPLDLACAMPGGAVVTVDQTFRTEVWSSDLRLRAGPPIVLRRRFAPNETPSGADSAALSSDGTTLLTRTALWEAPNGAHAWITVFDVPTGMALTDRIHLVDYGGEEVGASAVLSTSGTVLVVGGARRIALDVPHDRAASLPDVLEALGGLRLDAAGAPAPVVDRDVLPAR